MGAPCYQATGRSLNRSKGSDLWPEPLRPRYPLEKLGHAVDLVVVFAVGKMQDLGLEVLQPGGAFGQEHVALRQMVMARRFALISRTSRESA